MLDYPHFRADRLARRCGVSCLAIMLSCAAMSVGGARPANAEDGKFRFLTLNTWNDRFRSDLTQISNFLTNGKYDVIAWQELRSNSAYASQVPGILSGAGLGTYTSTQTGDTGLTYRLTGTAGGVNGSGSQGNRFSYVTLDAQNKMPGTTLASVHLDYSDGSANRIAEAKNINAWANRIDGPVIVVGDFNAGDVSERGMNSVTQQKLMLRDYLRSGNSFYYQLLTEYAVDRAQLDSFISTYRGQTINNSAIPDSMFRPETYAVASNTPQTMNILKKKFMLLQNQSEREQFQPHALRDGSTTWPSAGEDATNTWPSWDRAKIDHFLVSRPYGKWWVLADDPADSYVGVLDRTGFANNGTTPLSDHEPVAHTMKWVGPAIQKYRDTSSTTDKTRLIWGTEAAVFNEKGKVFYLTRNNMRTDLYLGQIADDNGMPTLAGLTLQEKKTLLDCTSTDARFQQAIAEYCIDDHSFIGQTLIKDGGTVIVDEDAALGGSMATVRLSDGRLRIAGTAMTSLNRDIVLEGIGGAIDVQDASNTVRMARVISGTGGLTKEGAGALNLTGTNTYTGQTSVNGGLLSVNGSIATSSLITVANGGVLGGNGTLGNLRVANGGTLAPGNSIGALTIAGNVTFDAGSTYRVEVDNAGNTDRITASGTIAINGGTLFFVPTSGDYLPLTDYQIMTASGGITGNFSSVGTSSAFLLPELSYGGTGVSVRLSRNNMAYASAATTANRRATASAIEALGGSNRLYKTFLPLDASTADEGFRQLSGELYPSIMGAMAEDSHFVRDAMTQRMGASAVNKPGNTGKDQGEFQFWGQAYGAAGQTDAVGVDPLDRKTGGVMFGADTMALETTRLGMVAGYGHSQFSLDGQSASGDSDSFTFGLYGSTTVGGLQLSYGSSVSLSEIDTKRQLAFGSFTDSVRGSFNATTAQVFGEAAYNFTLDEMTLQPFVGLAHVHVGTGSFSETGGAAALSARGGSYDQTFVSLGLRASSDLSLAGQTIRLHGEAGLRHALADDAPSMSMAFAGGGLFEIAGAGVNRDVAVIKGGFDIDLAKNATLSLDYVGGFSGDGGTHGVSAGLKVKF